MAKYLKKGLSSVGSDAANVEVQQTVAKIIADVRQRGDAAVRELSDRFDGWSPQDFRLSQSEIDPLVASVSGQTIEDIRFAQAQIRNFAEHQRAALKDIEVETLPGVRLGHRNIPVSSAGCYTPGGRYPMVASAHMTIVTAKVAGVERIIACTPPTKGKPQWTSGSSRVRQVRAASLSNFSCSSDRQCRIKTPYVSRRGRIPVGLAVF